MDSFTLDSTDFWALDAPPNMYQLLSNFMTFLGFPSAWALHWPLDTPNASRFYPRGLARPQPGPPTFILTHLTQPILQAQFKHSSSLVFLILACPLSPVCFLHPDHSEHSTTRTGQHHSPAYLCQWLPAPWGHGSHAFSYPVLCADALREPALPVCAGSYLAGSSCLPSHPPSCP